MTTRNIDLVRGELIGASRAMLAIYMRQHAAGVGNQTIEDLFDERAFELRRLVNNEFQFHGNDIGDPVQFALTVLLMNGEEHTASGRFTK